MKWLVLWASVLLCNLLPSCSASDSISHYRPPRITEHPQDLIVRKHEPTTLNCRATGKPVPSIQWYKDGEPVHNTANRMVLPSGSLFFLHVVHNRRDGDTGTYYCVARNEFGEVRSRNATIEVALLRDEFRVLPKNVEIEAGESALLECAPPKGFPEPTVSWKKNGEKIQLGLGRYKLIGSGNLLITHVKSIDEGKYQCVAENIIGVRKSPTVQLIVQPAEVVNTTEASHNMTANSLNSLNKSYVDTILRHPWFIVAVAIIFAVMVSIVIIVVVAKKRFACKKALSAHLTVPLHRSDEIGRSGFSGTNREAALWINHGWRPSEKDTNSKLLNKCTPNELNNGYSSAFVADYCSVSNAPDYAEVNTHNLTTFYKKETYPNSLAPAPYATTTLISAQSKHGSLREHKSNGSEEVISRKSDKRIGFEYASENGVKDHLLDEPSAKSPSESGSYTTDEYGVPSRRIKYKKHSHTSKPKSPSESGSYTTDEYGMPVRRVKYKHPYKQSTRFRPTPISHLSSESQCPKSPIVNWADLIPPPPDNPPSLHANNYYHHNY